MSNPFEETPVDFEDGCWIFYVGENNKELMDSGDEMLLDSGFYYRHDKIHGGVFGPFATENEALEDARSFFT